MNGRIHPEFIFAGSPFDRLRANGTFGDVS